MITPHGLGRLVCIKGNMHKELYREILQDNFLGTMDDLELDMHNYYFQQDNDLKHKASIVTKWFKENNINVLPWPASSPDMNIIEHVWHCLDQMVRRRDPLPQNLEQLWVVLQEEWARMDEGYIAHLYNVIRTAVSVLKDM
jgi:hypothetical protein